mmetsp:Transcript_16658/g.24312  ORF Transcript_16658/g.24312 Transcript_16658/m.24312 type:complete len:81 (+) Transcript_16658:571-813(+)
MVSYIAGVENVQMVVVSGGITKKKNIMAASGLVCREIGRSLLNILRRVSTTHGVVERDDETHGKRFCGALLQARAGMKIY